METDDDFEPDSGSDGYDWAVEEIRSIVEKLSQFENPTAKMDGPQRSLRTFNLINELLELIPDEEQDDNGTTNLEG